MIPKFRAWHKEGKKYYKVVCIHFEDKMLSLSTPLSHNPIDGFEYHYKTVSFDEVILEQYTGIKDKNGKEVYEGNIVAATKDCCCNPFIETFVVEFNNWGDHWESFQVKVVGNIHENKELLENE